MEVATNGDPIRLRDIYWVAGLLDGEGCFRYGGTPAITLGMTDFDTVKRYAVIVGHHTLGPNTYKHWKPQLRCKLYGIKAISWMMTIYPLMSSRRQEKIREVIEEWKLSKNRQKGSEYCVKGHRLTSENTYNYDNGKVQCRLCCKEKNAKRSQKKAQLVS